MLLVGTARCAVRSSQRDDPTFFGSRLLGAAKLRGDGSALVSRPGFGAGRRYRGFSFRVTRPASLDTPLGWRLAGLDFFGTPRSIDHKGDPDQGQSAGGSGTPGSTPIVIASGPRKLSGLVDQIRDPDQGQSGINRRGAEAQRFLTAKDAKHAKECNNRSRENP